MARLIDDPSALQPALGRLATLVKDYTASGGSLVVLAELSPGEAAAVILTAEALKQTTPDGEDPAAWAGAWLLAYEMQGGRR